MSDKRKNGPQNKAKNRPPAFGDVTSPDYVNKIYGGSGHVKVVNGPADADERKTVILDNELEGLEFDDKVWLFWRKNKNSVIALVCVVFISAAVSGLWRNYKESSKNALASEYAAASTVEQRTAFASENSGKTLAGIALLDNADADFKDSKFEEAAAAYKSASESLGGTLLYGRAVLGQGVSLIKAGKVEEGSSILVSMENNPETGAYGFEALYHLAMEDFASGKRDEAKARFQKIADNASSGYWGNIAKEYLSRLD